MKHVTISAVWDVDVLRVVCPEHIDTCYSNHLELVYNKDLQAVCDTCGIEGEF